MLNCLNISVGEIPTSFKESLSYYEALWVIINKVNELTETFNNVIIGAVSQYIDEHFNDIMMDAVYDSTDEALILSLSDGGN